MKKIASISALALSLVMAVSVFSSCGNSSSSASSGSSTSEHKEITATVEQSRNYPGLKKMIDYVSEKKNISVDLQVVPDDQYDNLIKMKLNSGEAPDLIDYNQPQIGGFLVTPEKYILDLSNEPWVQNLVAPDNCKYKGKVYGYPFNSIAGFQCMVYNKDVFKDAGIDAVPTTKADFDADCEKIKAKGISPILLPKDGWVPQIWMTAGYAQTMGTKEAATDFSTKLFSGKDKLTNHPELAAVIDDFASNVKKGYVNDDFMTLSYDSSIEKLATGKAGMYYQNGLNILSSTAKSFPDAKLGLFLYPADFNKKGLASVTPSSPGFSVYKDSKNLDTVKEVLNTWAEPDCAKLYYTDGNAALPALKDVDGGDVPQETMDYYNKYVKSGKCVTEMNTYMTDVQSLQSGTLWTYYQQAAQGKMTGAQLLEKFQGDIEKYMKEQKREGF